MMLRLFERIVLSIPVVMIVIAMFGVTSCGSTRSVLHRPSGPATSIDSTLLLIDPWSLGPDVFQQDTFGNYLNPQADVESRLGVETKRGARGVASDSTGVHSRGDGKLVVTDSVLNVSQAAVLPAIETPSVSHFTVQLGTFLDRDKADEFCARANAVLGITGKILSDWPFFRIRFGEFLSRESADSLYRVAMAGGFYDARVLKITN